MKSTIAIYNTLITIISNILISFQTFQTFQTLITLISNKHFCKLDKILRNFPSWQNFVFVTVYGIFGFEFCHFML